MDSHKLAFKLFADHADRLPLDAFVPIFHHWIQEQAMPGHLLIDVADYAHVPNGPGTLLVAHEANVHLDREDARPGLLYIRKQPIDGADTFRERLAAVFRAALYATAKMESDPTLAGVRFRTDEVVLRVHDRLIAPNEQTTFDAVRADLQAFFTELYGGNVALDYKPDAQRLFEVRIRPATKAATVSDLLSRLEALAPAPAR